MKIIITESKILDILQKFLNSFDYHGDEICEILIDPEPDASDSIWVYVVISQDWFLYGEGSQNIKEAWVGKIKLDILKKVNDFMGFNIRVGSYVKKCR